MIMYKLNNGILTSHMGNFANLKIYDNIYLISEIPFYILGVLPDNLTVNYITESILEKQFFDLIFFEKIRIELRDFLNYIETKYKGSSIHKDMFGYLNTFNDKYCKKNFVIEDPIEFVMDYFLFFIKYGVSPSIVENNFNNAERILINLSTNKTIRRKIKEIETPEEDHFLIYDNDYDLIDTDSDIQLRAVHFSNYTNFKKYVIRTSFFANFIFRKDNRQKKVGVNTILVENAFSYLDFIKGYAFKNLILYDTVKDFIDVSFTGTVVFKNKKAKDMLLKLQELKNSFDIVLNVPLRIYGNNNEHLQNIKDIFEINHLIENVSLARRNSLNGIIVHKYK